MTILDTLLFTIFLPQLSTLLFALLFTWLLNLRYSLPCSLCCFPLHFTFFGFCALLFPDCLRDVLPYSLLHCRTLHAKLYATLYASLQCIPFFTKVFTSFHVSLYLALAFIHHHTLGHSLLYPLLSRFFTLCFLPTALFTHCS